MNLKRDVVEFVARCFDFQRVKVECKVPGTATSNHDSRVEMGGYFHGFHHTVSEDSEIS